MRLLLCAAVAAVLAMASVGASHAQDAPTSDDVYAAYDAFGAARQAGDRDGAATAALQAWRLAEEVFGDTETDTAVLAYNAANASALAARPAEAKEAAERALELAEAGADGGAVPTELATLIVEYARFTENDSFRRRRAVLRALDDAGDAVDLVTISAASAVAVDALEKRQWDDLARAGQRLESDLSAIGAGPDQRVSALFYSAVGRINSARGAEDIRPVIAELYAAFDLFEPGSRKASDQGPLTLSTLLSAASALARSDGMSQNELDALDANPEPIVFASALPEGVTCEVTWAGERVPPRYPRSALDDFRVAALHVLYDFEDGGETTNVRVVANIGGDEFARSVLAAVSRWRAESVRSDPPGFEEACTKDQISMFVFEIQPD